MVWMSSRSLRASLLYLNIEQWLVLHAVAPTKAAHLAYGNMQVQMKQYCSVRTYLENNSQKYLLLLFPNALLTHLYWFWLR